MAIKLADTAKPMGDFPVAEAEDIEFSDGESLQEKLDNGTLGGDSNGLPTPDKVGMLLESFEDDDGNLGWRQIEKTDIVNNPGVSETFKVSSSGEYWINVVQVAIPLDELTSKFCAVFGNIEIKGASDVPITDVEFIATYAGSSTTSYSHHRRLSLTVMGKPLFQDSIIGTKEETAENLLIKIYAKSNSAQTIFTTRVNRVLYDIYYAKEVPAEYCTTFPNFRYNKESDILGTRLTPSITGAIDDSATSGTTTWSSAKLNANLGEKADKGDLVFKYYPMFETRSLNCNDITDYECIVTANNDNWSEMNYPVKDLLLITTHRNVDDGYQEARICHGERKFIRTMVNKVWQPWQELATMDKVITNTWIPFGDIFPIDEREVFQASWDATQDYTICEGYTSAGNEPWWSIMKRPDDRISVGHIESRQGFFLLRHNGRGWFIKRLDT